ncbi:MAG TPA: 23S rRNA (uridine(2552)-2'-O)-methyltransferase RlmE [Nevskiaceae bacterium]|nr:23S rRNA (uridine(2552)-2'-O)-methyltransferase RlmE [Nevskiaceae bacterium]
MTKKKRTPSSARWLAEHESDPYVKEARAKGYRSRAWFKLAEIDARDHLLRPGLVVVDLGAAPGGWSQYARPKLGPKGRLLALDILPMEPVAGVDFILGDFRATEILTAADQAMAARPADLVLSDMAPNISGINAADQAGSIGLAELALAFACDHLKTGGDLLVKVFSGEGFDTYLRELRRHFGRVVVRKPGASRARSREVYLLARNYRPV